MEGARRAHRTVHRQPPRAVAGGRVQRRNRTRMPDQTPMNHNGSQSPSEGVRHGVAGLLHDVTTLAELQIKLLALDTKAASRRAVVPISLLAIAGVFAL